MKHVAETIYKNCYNSVVKKDALYSCFKIREKTSNRTSHYEMTIKIWSLPCSSQRFFKDLLAVLSFSPAYFSQQLHSNIS